MQLSKEDIIKFLSENTTLLKDRFGVTNIALFGSFARGEETEESDIDLFVEMPPSLGKISDLIEFLEHSFKRKVDVTRKHPYMKERFLEEIIKDSINV